MGRGRKPVRQTNAPAHNAAMNAPVMSTAADEQQQQHEQSKSIVQPPAESSLSVIDLYSHATDHMDAVGQLCHIPFKREATKCQRGKSDNTPNRVSISSVVL
jgi:hypothetical protein